MIEEAEQQINRLKDIIHAPPIKLVQTANQQPRNSQQIKLSIRKAHQSIQILDKQQKRLFKPSRRINQQLQNILSPLKIYDYHNLITKQNFGSDMYRQLSIFPIITQIVLSQLNQLIEMQTDIDSSQSTLVKINNQSVMDIVTKTLQFQTSLQMLNYLIRQLSSLYTYQQTQQKMLKPLLQNIILTLRRLGPHVNIDDIYDAIFNTKLPPIVFQQNNVSTIQSQALKKAKKQNQQIFKDQIYQKSFRNYTIQMLKHKRGHQIKHQTFFKQVQDVPDFTSFVNQSLEEQIKTLKKYQQNRNSKIKKV